MPPCALPKLIVGRFPPLTFPLTTSSAVICSNLRNTCAPTLPNCPYSASRRTQATCASHLTSTLPMTTHTSLMTNDITPLAFPSRSWVINSTPSYTAPSFPPSPTLPSSALPALFAYTTSALGLHTPHFHKPLFPSDPPPPNSFAKTTKHRLTLLALCVHNSSTHFNLIFSNTNPQSLLDLYRPSPPPLVAPPPRIHSARCDKVPLTRGKCFMFCFGKWTASSPPLTTIPLGIWKRFLCTPPAPSSWVHCDTSASPLPSLNLTLIKHRAGKKRKSRGVHLRRAGKKRKRETPPPPTITFQDKQLPSNKKLLPPNSTLNPPTPSLRHTQPLAPRHPPP